MRVGVIQSSYIPWRGYFDFISNVDAFVFHDDIQYTKGDWRNRNQIKTSAGLEWLTVPVHHQKTSQLICDTQISKSFNWWKKHPAKFYENYRKAPFVDDAMQIFSIIDQDEFDTISSLNIAMIKLVCNYLQITTPLYHSSDFKLNGTKTERLIELLKKIGASVYLSGPTADAYLDKSLFAENNIILEYKSYEYRPYNQLWGDFYGSVSVLDMIANCGKNSRDYLSSYMPNKIIVGNAPR